MYSEKRKRCYNCTMQSINQTNYTNADDLVITTMEDVIYIGMKNDLSFIIVNEMNLYEHQSTLNENMPLRGFLYLAKLYESYIETHKLNRHDKKMIKLPFPRFIVFYNGEKEVPEVFEMRLSDAFDKKEEEPAVECIARFININYGKNQELMDSCKRLHDYSYFVAVIRDNLKNGMNQREAVACAIDECIEKGILEDVLIKHRTEVESMFLTTYDKKMHHRALMEEGREMERANTERERQRAEKAKKRAEDEKKRAEVAEEENRRLREEIARLQGK